ncbi:bifunctional 2-polyprenyl-6-hydroxyphenol methylase/3-demethylubiquinol 3-O-methyltransferase UbiG [uncultured Microbulbifer sp.]|uniref:class I SAM-dependent methyltransferase n=1 Tax=uncultured Microbulbifer sp. TaxID=348147 RepID=UPI0026246947|nr:class I SAM-dependent methyltransferase [uncultured Microbulbifer sp.]
MKYKFYTEQTLESWNQVAEIHQRRNPELLKKASASDFNALEVEFNRLVDAQNLDSASVVQVCCNNGKDLLSIKNKGAGYCLGIDGSDKFIEQARALSQHPHYTNVQFETYNIYEIPERHYERFDFAVVTVGVVNWMPDLPRFFEICNRLLKPGGALLMEEIHPVLNMYQEGSPSKIAYSYFNREAQLDTDGLDYFSGEKYDAEPNYYFQHTLGDILTAAIASGLHLQTFEESASNIGNYCKDLADAPHSLPMAFIASWRKG